MYMADPPRAFGAEPNGVSIESIARDPTTRTLTGFSGKGFQK
jgi:hypothetical protein